MHINEIKLLYYYEIFFTKEILNLQMQVAWENFSLQHCFVAGKYCNVVWNFAPVLTVNGLNIIHVHQVNKKLEIGKIAFNIFSSVIW